jgi:hypothetical protein
MRDKILEKIEKRLQLLITISIFFSGTIYAFLRATHQPDEVANQAVLGWGALILTYILSYFFSELLQRRIKNEWLNLISTSSLWAIGLFAFPIWFLGASSVSGMPYYLGVMFVFSVAFLVIVALAIMAFILLGGLLFTTRERYASN